MTDTIKNLDKLLQVAQWIKEDNLEFDMEHFRDEEFRDRDDCGTSGCLLGWCPVIGQGDLEREAKQPHNFINGALEWRTYSRNVFGIAHRFLAGRLEPNNTWNWLFDGGWPSDIDAAINRIKFLMEKGQPPEQFTRLNSVCDYIDAVTGDGDYAAFVSLLD